MTTAEINEILDAAQPAILEYIDPCHKGPLEKYRTAKELRNLLLALRRDLIVPPWHPITEVFKEKARALISGRKGMLSEDFWFRMHPNTTGTVKGSEIGKQTWVYLRVNLVEDGVVFGGNDYCVDPHKGYVWTTNTEHMVDSKNGYLVIYSDADKKKPDGSYKRSVNIRLAVLLEKAKSLFDTGTFFGTLDYVPTRKPWRTESHNRCTKKSEPQQVAEEPVIEDTAQEVQESPKPQVVKPRFANLFFSDADHQVLDFMCAIACKEYPELMERFKNVHLKARDLLK